MKKLLILFSFAALMTACNQHATQAETEVVDSLAVDSVEVVVDSVAIDTLSIN